MGFEGNTIPDQIETTDSGKNQDISEYLSVEEKDGFKERYNQDCDAIKHSKDQDVCNLLHADIIPKLGKEEDEGVLREALKKLGEKYQQEAIMEIPFNGNKLRMVSLEDYDPPTSNQKIEITDDNLVNFLHQTNAIEISAVNASEVNDRTTDDMADMYLEEYLAHVPTEKLLELGVTDLLDLKPKEAIKLAGMVVTDKLSYDFAQTKVGLLDRVYEDIFDKGNDDKTLVELLDGGKGVCRNYAEAVHIIFDAIKRSQVSGESNLENTYATYFSTMPVEAGAASTEYIADDHAWNTFYTVSEDGILSGLHIDATQYDYDMDKNVEGANIDYTYDRALFTFDQMQYHGLINDEEKVTYLEEWVLKNDSNTPGFDAVNYEIIRIYAKEVSSIDKSIDLILSSDSFGTEEFLNLFGEGHYLKLYGNWDMLDKSNTIKELLDKPATELSTKELHILGYYHYFNGNIGEAIDVLDLSPLKEELGENTDMALFFSTLKYIDNPDIPFSPELLGKIDKYSKETVVSRFPAVTKIMYDALDS